MCNVERALTSLERDREKRKTGRNQKKEIVKGPAFVSKIKTKS
jgi:hypothetical protein